MNQISDNQTTYRKYKRTRFWAVINGQGALVAVVVYKKGARTLVNLLNQPVPYTLTQQGEQALAQTG